MMTGIRSVVLIFCLAAVTNANWETVRRSTSGLVGGWREHKYPSESQKFITLAYQAFADALGEPYLHGTNLRVSKASTQVVAGLNHKLEVEQTQVSCGFKRPANGFPDNSYSRLRLHCQHARKAEQDAG
uniref:Putative cystatin n=1 Tax=Rhipicephalus microplus TaxID=6941 RepID=A0A6G5A9M0_RHIMP